MIVTVGTSTVRYGMFLEPSSIPHLVDMNDQMMSS
jgi:hypothetical protein